MTKLGAIDRFYDYLRSILKVYADMAPVLAEEIACIQNDDMAGLDGVLKLQQAMLLRTRGFESRIAAYQKELGVEAGSLSAAVVQLPEEERFRFYALLGEFDQAVERVCFYKDQCRELLQAKLYVMDKRAAGAGLSQNVTYDEFAEGVSLPYAKAFEKRI